MHIEKLWIIMKDIKSDFFLITQRNKHVKSLCRRRQRIAQLKTRRDALSGTMWKNKTQQVLAMTDDFKGGSNDLH